MKPFRSSSAIILGAINLFSVSNAKAGSCNSHVEMNAKIESLSEYKKCIDSKKIQSLYKVEA